MPRWICCSFRTCTDKVQCHHVALDLGFSNVHLISSYFDLYFLTRVLIDQYLIGLSYCNNT
jgi:hypothetical protein